MSGETAAALFEDDLMAIVLRRLSVQLQTFPGDNSISVVLVDNKTGYAFQCEGARLHIRVSTNDPKLPARRIPANVELITGY